MRDFNLMCFGFKNYDMRYEKERIKQLFYIENPWVIMSKFREMKVNSKNLQLLFCKRIMLSVRMIRNLKVRI